MTSEQGDFQEQVLRSYTILRLLDPEPDAGWGGGFIISVSLGPLGASVALAANIAGAVSLAIDARPEMCRTALRSGACDFAVNSVDEALRVIKNEIRKYQPLSVALEMQPAQALDELTERGVKPELFADLCENSETDIAAHQAISYFKAHGTPVVTFDHVLTQSAVEGILDGSKLLSVCTAIRNLGFCSFVFSSNLTLRIFDARAAELLGADPIRRQWSLAAARHFLRERPHHRALLLYPVERAQLEDEFPGALAVTSRLDRL